MANICVYKIKVRGTETACYRLVDMMPLYCGETEYLSEEGSSDDFTLIFKGDCKWSVDAYTSPLSDPQPLSINEIEAITHGDHWDVTLQDKSILLGCEIFCNSMDVDDSFEPIYEHYNKGEVIYDECPEELYIDNECD